MTFSSGHNRPEAGEGAKRRVTPLRATVLAFLVITLAVSCFVGFSGASFVTSSSNTTVNRAGALTITNSSSGGYVIDISNLRPGQSQTGTLTLTIAGDFSASVVAQQSSLTNTPSSAALASVLTMRIDEINAGTGAVIQTFYGPATMSGFASANFGTLAVGSTHTYKFTVTFPTASATSSLQGASTNMAITFTGVAQ